MPEGVHLFSVFRRERQTELLCYNKGGLDHVEVTLDQR